ncbi:MAG TPA: glycosyltransferase [Microthrixaceae bacterium]|nr:glycosyltransferase [Microthrixaceae bacterium]
MAANGTDGDANDQANQAAESARHTPPALPFLAAEGGTESRLASELAAWLRSYTVDQVTQLVNSHIPRWRLPATFGGHPVEPDVAADLIYTLGHLHDGGVTELAGTAVGDAVRSVLGAIDGRRTHTFFSYRVAETLLRWGPTFDGNPLLNAMTPAQVDQVRIACDSSEWLALLDQAVLPQNYAGVLARCESARLRLGLLDEADRSTVDALVERARGVLSSNPRHYLDDSSHHVGRYDIYSADVWLFTQPFAEQLGALWDDGIATALALVEATMSSDGTAVSWGRSTGPLAAALTVELGALAVADGLGDSAGLWLARAALAAESMPGWFTDGVTNAHQHRDADGYRGPFRRLQLTLDLLGKLAWAANQLDRAAADIRCAPLGDVLGPLDELVRFDDERNAAVWTHRGDRTAFVVPFVGASRSDYLAAPRAPGRFEVPVDSELACWVPTLIHGNRRAVPSGVPDSLTHTAHSVTARWDRLTYDAELDPPADPTTVEGSAEVTYRAVGRTVEARWTIDAGWAPDSIVFLVPERPDQPLRVTAHSHGDTTVHIDEVDVSGVAEWRSHWSSFATLHEIEVLPQPVSPDPGDRAVRAEVTLTVTPRIRVASTAHGAQYDTCLYGPLTGLVQELRCPWGPLADPAVDPGAVDLLHLHWPEWLAFDDLDSHRAIVADVRARRVPVVWTAHNLTPHEKQPEIYDPIYELWAANVDAVIHHSRAGMQQFLARYRTRPETRHVVIPHGHFGATWADHLPISRAEAEAALGLSSTALRIGLVGAPRSEKLVSEFLRGVAASTRADIEVVCWSLDRTDEVPDDDRIAIAERYEMVRPDVYALRLAACDVLAMPFDPDGEMLATGTVFDAIGLGLPVLRSDWEFLTEVLGDAAIPVGHTAASVAAALDDLDAETVHAAAIAAELRRDELGWDVISSRTLALFEDVLAAR